MTAPTRAATAPRRNPPPPGCRAERGEDCPPTCRGAANTAGTKAYREARSAGATTDEARHAQSKAYEAEPTYRAHRAAARRYKYHHDPHHKARQLRHNARYKERHREAHRRADRERKRRQRATAAARTAEKRGAAA